MFDPQHTTVYRPSTTGGMNVDHLAFDARSAPLLTFRFSVSQNYVLNSVVLGPASKNYFQITTDHGNPRRTVLQNSKYDIVGSIDWQSQPLVELLGIVPKQPVSRWVGLSPDQSSRNMNVRDKSYRWISQANSVWLYSIVGVHPSEMFARISRESDFVKLELTPQAIQAGLLEVSVMATILFQSGFNID